MIGNFPSKLFAYVDRRRYGFKARDQLHPEVINEMILDPYSLIMVAFSTIVLIYYVTYINLFPTVAVSALAGLVIGAMGLILGFMIGVLNPKVFGQTRLDMFTPSVRGTETLALVVILLGLTSFGLQVLVKVAAPQAVINAPTTPFDRFLYLQAMAVMEEVFFRYFLFRFFRGALFKNWILGAIVTSSIFGFVYHQVVYGFNIPLMFMAFIGSMLYCFAGQLTRRLSVSQMLHQGQNLVSFVTNPI